MGTNMTLNLNLIGRMGMNATQDLKGSYRE